jgi:ribose transport system substrate-binding protein
MKKSTTAWLAVLLVAALVVGGVLLSQKGDLQKTVDDLTAQVTALTAELDTAKSEAAATAEQAAAAAAEAEALKKQAEEKAAAEAAEKAAAEEAAEKAAAEEAAEKAAAEEAAAKEAAEKAAAEEAAKKAAEEAAAKEAAEKAAAEKAENSKYKIGILAPAVTHGWVAGVAYNAEYQAKELADVVEYKMATSTNAEEMTAQLDDLLTWGAQAIVAFPQWEGMEVPIQAAIDKGVVVVNFDIVINAKGIYLVTGDNESMGVEGAKYIVDKIGKTGTVIALPVPTSGSVSQLRMKGFMDTIKEIAPDMTVIEYATKFTREDGLKDFTDILAANPQIDAVYSLDDETSIGVLQAISDANRTDIKVITGGGGSQGYFKMMPENKDIWIASALYSPLMVRDAVDVAVAVLKGETVDPVKVIPTTIVDRTNYEQFLDPDSVY